MRKADRVLSTGVAAVEEGAGVEETSADSKSKFLGDDRVARGGCAGRQGSCGEGARTTLAFFGEVRKGVSRADEGRAGVCEAVSLSASEPEP